MKEEINLKKKSDECKLEALLRNVRRSLLCSLVKGSGMFSKTLPKEPNQMQFSK